MYVFGGLPKPFELSGCCKSFLFHFYEGNPKRRLLSTSTVVRQGDDDDDDDDDDPWSTLVESG